MRFRRFLFASLPPDAPAAIVRLFALWRDLRIAENARRGEAPASGSFRGALGPFEPHVSVARYSAEREDVFVFSSGPETRRLLGVDLTRRWMSEIFDARKLAIAAAPYRAAARVGRPTYSATEMGPSLELARLILPVSAPSADPTFIVAVYPIVSRSPAAPRFSDRFADAAAPVRTRFVILAVDVLHTDERQREVARVLKRVRSARVRATEAVF